LLKKYLPISMRKKVEKLLERPAIYMRPHKNALTDEILRRNKFKPKVLIGDLRKPNTEFTSDLVTIAH
jgi:hypothetical protein